MNMEKLEKLGKDVSRAEAAHAYWYNTVLSPFQIHLIGSAGLIVMLFSGVGGLPSLIASAAVALLYLISFTITWRRRVLSRCVKELRFQLEDLRAAAADDAVQMMRQHKSEQVVA